MMATLIRRSLLWMGMGIMVLLAACSGPGAIDRAVVEKAIALQASQTQQELSQLLTATPPKTVGVEHVKVKQQETVAIEDFRAFRLQGSYDLTLYYSGRQITQRHNPFEVYLQPQPNGEGWRLVRPAPGEFTLTDGEASRWLAYPIP